jgi:alpha-tubulin suppressor-like RCC1 family protein
MREELPQANPWAGDTQAQAIAEGLAMIEQLTPGLFDIPEDARRLDNRAAVETVERAVCRRVADCIPRHRRTADTTVSARIHPIDATAMWVTASVTVADGRHVDQDFECHVEAGKPRARVTRSGTPRLVDPSGEDCGAVSAIGAGGTSPAATTSPSLPSIASPSTESSTSASSPLAAQTATARVRRHRGRRTQVLATLVGLAAVAAIALIITITVSAAGGRTPATALAAGDSNSCAVVGGTEVYCWGDDSASQLGVNVNTASSQTCPGFGPTTSGPCSTKPVQIVGVDQTAAIATGFQFACAADGTVQCWGGNSDGQLGDGSTEQPRFNLPVEVSGIKTATAITTGSSSDACALVSRGKVYCWGNNTYGELGDGTTTDRTTPVSASGISHAIAIAAGGRFTCAALSSGRVDCWGDNGTGALGSGTASAPQNCSGDPCSTTPAPVTGINHAISVAAGNVQACALLSSGTVECWGDSEDGALGDGTTAGADACHSSSASEAVPCSTTPVQVAGITHAVVIAAGSDYNCAVLSGGAVDCWGDNYKGQLGQGTTVGPQTCHGPLVGTSSCTATPVRVTRIRHVTAIAAAQSDLCALLSNGTVTCWGDNSFGQLGDGTTTRRNEPVPVKGIP